MHLPNFKKKFVGAALAAGMVMGAGGAAFAYFSAHATAKGDADVGTFTGTLKVTHTNTALPNETPLFPGHSVRQVFVVSNTGTTPIKVTSVTAKLTKSPTGTYILTDNSNTPVVGCLASWFTLMVTGTQPTSVMGLTLGGSHNQAVIVTMKTTGTQNACMGAQPLFTLTIRGTNA